MTDPERKTRVRILPREAGAAPLDVVIGVMAFLAALALGASLIADRAADSWRAGLAGRLTVQILPPLHGAADLRQVLPCIDLPVYLRGRSDQQRTISQEQCP